MTTTTKNYNDRIGSISSATLRSEDLIPAFFDEIERLDPDWADQYDKGLVKEFGRRWLEKVCESEDGTDSEIVNELIDKLDELAPPYFYFGAHPGDGADFGYWLHEDFETDFDGLKVSDTSEIPADYIGEALHVNDHGNVTLYHADKGSLSEIWAVV